MFSCRRTPNFAVWRSVYQSDAGVHNDGSNWYIRRFQPRLHLQSGGVPDVVQRECYGLLQLLYTDFLHLSSLDCGETESTPDAGVRRDQPVCGRGHLIH